MKQYYTVVKGPNQDDFIAICEKCPRKKKYKITKKSVASVDRHYLDKHRGICNEYKNQKKRKSKELDCENELSDIEPKRKKQMTIPIYTARPRPRRSDDKTCENNIMDFFIEEMVSFRIIEGKSFKHMIGGFDSDFKIMNRHKLRSNIMQKYSSTRKTLTGELQNAIAIATTADSWSKGNRYDYIIFH